MSAHTDNERSEAAVDVSRLVLQMAEALEANGVFHTPLERGKHGDWNDYQIDAINRTRNALQEYRAKIHLLQNANEK